MKQFLLVSNFILLFFFVSIPAFSTNTYITTDTTSTIDTANKDYLLKAYRVGEVVKLELTLLHPENIVKLVLERSPSILSSYTSILSLETYQIKTGPDQKVLYVDRFPLAQTQNVYYGVAVEEISGVVRFYPPTEMPRINSSSMGNCSK